MNFRKKLLLFGLLRNFEQTNLLGRLEEVRQVGRVLDLRQELVELRVLVWKREIHRFVSRPGNLGGQHYRGIEKMHDSRFIYEPTAEPTCLYGINLPQELRAAIEKTFVV